MKVEFENLGTIKKGELDLNNLKGINLIIGKNNSGKTYFSYLLYAVLRNIKIERNLNLDKMSKEIRGLGKREENNFSNELLRTDLPYIFHTTENYFENTKINIIFDENEKWFEGEKYFLENGIKFNEIYFFPAERSGAMLFYKQLFQNGNEILRKFELTRDTALLENISNYPEPINEYMKFLNRDFTNKNETEIYKNILKRIKDIINGEIVIKDNKIIYKNHENIELNMGLVSSTVKTLAGFFLYLKYEAKEGDIIFIDEIELNLHPENQRKMLNLINYLSKQGIKFILSTHSPLVTQEINNMILYEEKRKNSNIGKIDSEYEIHEDYGIDKNNINVRFLNEDTIKEIEIDEEGFETETFNEVVAGMNNFYQDLYFLDEE